MRPIHPEQVPAAASIGSLRQRSRAWVLLAPVVALCAGCSDMSSVKLFPDAGPMAVARLGPKNGSTVRGVVSFTQRGDKVAIVGNFVELFPGPHSIYIHAGGNCSSPNAASAGSVWNVDGTPGGKRTGDLPLVTGTGEGYGNLQVSSSALSVGTGKPNDVIGHSVVIHAGVDPDPKPEFGVRNGWLACGVIVRSEGFDWSKAF